MTPPPARQLRSATAVSLSVNPYHAAARSLSQLPWIFSLKTLDNSLVFRYTRSE
jgi:hypothetical protein